MFISQNMHEKHEKETKNECNLKENCFFFNLNYIVVVVAILIIGQANLPKHCILG